MTKNMFKKYYPKKKVGKDLTKKINTVLKKHGIGKTPQVKHHVTYLTAVDLVDVSSASSTLLPPATMLQPNGPAGTPLVPLCVKSLMPFTQGDQFDNRYGGTIEGQNINCKAIHLKGHFWTTVPASGAINPEARMVLVWDTDCSGNINTDNLLYVDTLPLTTAALRTTERELLWAPMITSPININNKKTFQVLYDKTFVLTNAGFKDNLREFDIKIDLKQVTASFAENSASTGSMLPQNRDLQLFLFAKLESGGDVTMSIVSDFTFTNVI